MPPDTQLNQLIDKVGKVESAVARLEATLAAFLARTRDEVDALFAVRSGHEVRLTEIERSYVPKNECGNRITEFGKRLTKVENDVTNVRIRLAMIFGAAVVVSSVANALLTVLIRYLWN